MPETPNSSKPRDLHIHVEWDGPFTLEEIGSLDGPTDYGLYQIYGCHSVYGSNCLLYIGKAAARTFAVRIAEEWHWPVSQDAGRVEVYVGRLSGGGLTPKNEDWERQITLAEALLIFAHAPARNSKSILYLQGEPDLQNVHVLNWSRHRDLLPEVSGARWTNRFQGIPNWHPFTTEEFQK